jgi:hypothetical protein
MLDDQAKPAYRRRLSELRERTGRGEGARKRRSQAVAKSIKSVLDRIAQSDAGLSDVLSRCIKIGTFYSYQPV